MADNGLEAMDMDPVRKVFTGNIATVLAGSSALIIGIFVGSPVGRIICGLILLACCARIGMEWWKRRNGSVGDNGDREEEMYPPQSPESTMKKLLFDDFQSSSSGKYQVKEIEEEEKVVPSMKTTQPAAIVLKEERVRELDVLDFFDLDSDEPYSEVEPKSEFHSLTNKVLLVLKEVLFAHTVAFFWANREKQQMVLESMATDSRSFSDAKRFPMEEDLASQVATTGKPQVLGRVNPSSEKELIRYYESPAYVKSVLGVPVFFKDGAKDILPVGVIIADSKAEDAFGPETLALLGRFTKLISALIKSYTDKYDLLLDSELLTSLRRLQDRVKSEPGERTVLESVAEEANRLAGWDCLTIAMYDEEKHGWVLQKVVNKTGQAYADAEELVEINGSIVGEVIRTNEVSNVHDLSGVQVVRFHSGEHPPLGGSFLCLPISSFNRCYGALTLESKTKSSFSGSEVETIYRLVEHAAAALEVIYMNDLVKDYIAIDHVTGSLTKKYFLKKLEEEVRRAEDFGTELAFVSIALDGEQELTGRYGKESFDVVVNECVRILRANMRQYDVLGRQEGERLGVLLVNTAASDAYLWAEKMRKLIASHVITLGVKSFSVTISAGVCGLTDGMHAEELVDDSSQVLARAVENGGNLVRVF